MPSSFGSVSRKSGSIEGSQYVANVAMLGGVNLDIRGKFVSLDGHDGLGAQNVLSGSLDKAVFNNASGSVIQALNKLASNQGSQRLQDLSDTALVSLDNGDFLMWNGSAFTDKTSLQVLQQVVGSSITQAEAQVLDGASAGTVAGGKAVVYGASGEVAATTISIGGVNLTSTATELNLLDGVTGLVQADFTKLAAVDASAAEIDLLDAGTAIGSAVGDLADGDGIIIEDGDVMKKLPLSDLATYIAGKQSFDTEEEIQDVAGAMFSSNTETGITATYQDADGTIDLVVNVAAGQIAADAVGAAGIKAAGVGTAELQDAAIVGGKLAAAIDHSTTNDYLVLQGGQAAGGLILKGKDIDGASKNYNFKIDGGVLQLVEVSLPSFSAGEDGVDGD